MLKKLLCLMMAVLLCVQPAMSNAADLGFMFDNLTTGGDVAAVNKPGRFQSGARNVFTAGGFEMRAPATANAPNLISFTPPTGINASCSGISAFFGGFSFISGKEFEQLLKNIGSGVAQGFVAHLALKALCPYCENVAALMQRLNQVAAQASKNACQWGKQMAATLESQLLSGGTGGNAAPSVNNECGLRASGEGMAADFLKGMESMCSSIGESLKSLDSTLESYSKKLDQMNLTPEQKNLALTAQQQQATTGNQTWKTLNAMLPGNPSDTETLHLKTWLLNLVGTTITATNAKCGSVAWNPNMGESGLLCPSTGAGLLGGDELMVSFLCGTKLPSNPSPADKDIVKYCETSLATLTGSAARSVYVCDDPELCLSMTAVPLSSNPVVGGVPLVDSKGMVFRVRELLGEAVRRVSSDQALVSGESDKTGKQILALIQLAPYPLYQAINAAAVYPSASMDILNSLTVLLAENLTYSFVDEALRLRGRSSGGTQINANMANRVNDALSHMRSLQKERQSMMAQNLVVQEQLAAQIRQLNIAIQRSVMTNDIVNGNRLAASVGGSLSTLNAGNGGKAGTGGQ